MYFTGQSFPRKLRTRNALGARKNALHLCAFVYDGEGNASFQNGDIIELDDFEFCKERIDGERERLLVDSVLDATKLCMQACGQDLVLRQKTLERALSICPDHCPLAHILLFQMALQNHSGFRKENAIAMDQAQKAVTSGRALIQLLRGEEFAKGNFYNFVPTRNYIRACKNYASYLLHLGKNKEAYNMFQECLANDIHDKLGARHGQLLALLAGKKGMKDARIATSLKSRFGEEMQMDDTFALWNYTRALHTFNKHGDGKKATKLLNLAIERNPFVPPLLLHWKSCFQINDIVLMPIGGEVEAFNYVRENRKHWSIAALEFLEKLFCLHGKANIPLISKSSHRITHDNHFDLFAFTKVCCWNYFNSWQHDNHVLFLLQRSLYILFPLPSLTWTISHSISRLVDCS